MNKEKEKHTKELVKQAEEEATKEKALKDVGDAFEKAEEAKEKGKGKNNKAKGSGNRPRTDDAPPPGKPADTSATNDKCAADPASYANNKTPEKPREHDIKVSKEEIKNGYVDYSDEMFDKAREEKLRAEQEKFDK